MINSQKEVVFKELYLQTHLWLFNSSLLGNMLTFPISFWHPLFWVIWVGRFKLILEVSSHKNNNVRNTPCETWSILKYIIDNEVATIAKLQVYNKY